MAVGRKWPIDLWRDFMFNKKEDVFRKIVKDQRGFSLMELFMVVAIISILAGLTMLYIGDTLDSARDSAAISDATNLIIVVNNNFIDKESIDYKAIGADGIEIGVTDSDGNVRDPIFRLSPGVQIYFENSADPTYNKCFDDERQSSFTAYLYHNRGSEDIWGLNPSGSDRRCVQCIVDELTSTQELIFF